MSHDVDPNRAIPGRDLDYPANVTTLGKSLDNAMLDAINALPAEDREAMCDRVRDVISHAPMFEIIDGRAAPRDRSRDMEDRGHGPFRT